MKPKMKNAECEEEPSWFDSAEWEESYAWETEGYEASNGYWANP